MILVLVNRETNETAPKRKKKEKETEATPTLIANLNGSHTHINCKFEHASDRWSSLYSYYSYLAHFYVSFKYCLVM